jgi:hypothetical protein
MVGAFLLDAAALGGLQDGRNEAYRAGARLPVSSLRRAVPDVIFRSLELNDHTFFYAKLKRAAGRPKEQFPAY